MRTLPINASDSDIRVLVVEWSELLAKRHFAEALAMFDVSCEALDWSPQVLETWISHYGSEEPLADGATFQVSSLSDLPDAAILIRERIDVDRENLYGLDPSQYVGMVHYSDVPLNGQRSDLTARFHIKRLGTDQITLEFLDILVM